MKRLFCMAIAAIAMLSVYPRLASADCGSKLVGTSWTCAYDCNVYGSGTQCVEFGHYGLSSYFDTYASGFSGAEGCACESSGTEKRPGYDSSPSTFLCSEDGYPSSFLGKVSGKKMTLQYTDAYGGICLDACTENSASSCP